MSLLDVAKSYGESLVMQRHKAGHFNDSFALFTPCADLCVGPRVSSASFLRVLKYARVVSSLSFCAALASITSAGSHSTRHLDAVLLAKLLAARGHKSEDRVLAVALQHHLELLETHGPPADVVTACRSLGPLERHGSDKGICVSRSTATMTLMTASCSRHSFASLSYRK